MTISEEKRLFVARLTEITDALNYPERGRQTMLANYYKVTQGACRKWYAGESMPAYEIQKDLCTRAHVNYEWLLTGRGEKTFTPIKYEATDYRLDQVIRVMQTMPDYMKDQVVKIVNAISTPTPNNQNSQSIDDELKGIAMLNNQHEDILPKPANEKPHRRQLK